MPPPCVLVLRGLRFADYRAPEDILEERLMGEDFSVLRDECTPFASDGELAPSALDPSAAGGFDDFDGFATSGDAFSGGDGGGFSASGDGFSISGSYADSPVRGQPGDRNRDPIPTCFRRIEEWPLASPYLCWTCGGPCDTPPRFRPTYLNRTPDGGFELGVEGVMCRFACAARYIEDQPFSKTERHRAQTLLLEECEAFTGARPAYIAPAPKRTRLTAHGGDLTRAQFVELADAIEGPLGVPDAAELRARVARLAADDAPEADSSALCMNEYKEQVTRLGLLQ